MTVPATPVPAPARALPDRRFGYLVTILGVMWLSPDALLQRLIDGDALAIVAWRGALSMVMLALFLRWRDGGAVVARMRAGGWRLMLLAILYAMNSTSFVMAIDLSSVADVLVILAATPLCAAVLAWFVLREVPDRRTSLAIAIGAVGVLIAAVGGMTGGSPAGMALAVFTTLNLAAQFTLLRRWPQVDNVAAVFIGSFFMAVLGFTVAEPLAMEGASLFWAFMLGLFLTPIAFTLITVGPRHIGAAEVSLLMLLETAFGPLWVWLVLGEAPATTALIGGAIIVVAIVVSACGPRPGSAFGRTT